MRRHQVIAVAALAAFASVHEVVHEPFTHLSDDRFTHARVDPLPFAGAIAMTQSGQCVKYDGRRDRVIGPGSASLTWRSARIALRIEHSDETACHWAPSHPARRLHPSFAE